MLPGKEPEVEQELSYKVKEEHDS